MSTVDSDAALAEAMLAARNSPLYADPPAPVEEDDRPVSEDYTPAEFDPKWREPFSGLLYLGALTKRVEIWGHSFVISTPTQTERMQIGLVVKDYIDTIAGNLAYSTAFVAACLTHVDDHPLPRPVTNDPKESALFGRFRWIEQNMQKVVIDELYSRCLELDMDVQNVLEAMGKV